MRARGMEDEQVIAAVQAAISSLRSEEPQLEYQIVHERTTAHRLALHMEPHFAGWNVDCEYDRDVSLKKFLNDIRHCDEQKRTDAIFPDIVVHHRRGQRRAHNLLVVEIKKNAATDVCDRMKLELMTQPGSHFDYQLGLYINVDGGKFTGTWYKNGAVVPAGG